MVIFHSYVKLPEGKNKSLLKNQLGSSHRRMRRRHASSSDRRRFLWMKMSGVQNPSWLITRHIIICIYIYVSYVYIYISYVYMYILYHIYTRLPFRTFFIFFLCAAPSARTAAICHRVSSSLPTSGFGPLVKTSMGWDALMTTFIQSFK